jgi:hypothetical protein
LSSTCRSAPGVVDGDRHVEASVAGPHVVEEAQRLAGEEAELGVVPLGLEFGDDHHGTMTSCSAKWSRAFGSDSSTEVSIT